MIADQGAQILHERAQRLAARDATPARSSEIEVIMFRLGPEEYAVRLASLRGVHAVDGLTNVPSTPPTIAGILNLRGEIITILDLAAVLAVKRDQTANGQILTVEANDQMVGLLVDEILETGRVSPTNLDSSIAAQEFVTGVSRARTALLDIDRLFALQGFEIQQDAL